MDLSIKKILPRYLSCCIGYWISCTTKCPCLVMLQACHLFTITSLMIWLFWGTFLSQTIINKANRCVTVFFSRDHNKSNNFEPVKLPKIVKNSFIVLLSLPFSFFFAKLLQICQIHFPSFSKKIEGVLLLTFINLLQNCWIVEWDQWSRWK